ncbi:MAG TPA: type VI secretion system contractile sheath large subunit, partial [Gemmataceae bacterium]
MSAEEQAQAQAEAAGAAAATEEASLIEQALTRMRATEDDAARKRGMDALGAFLAQAVQPGKIVSKDTETNIKFWINAIDQKLSAQLNEILHHPDFQKLEGTWRGLFYLVNQTETEPNKLELRVLNVTKDELRKDLENAVEFDMSETFKKVYEEEYGILGGHPYGMLVGDYEFDVRRPQDMSLLSKMSNVAAAAHAPFVAAPSPKAFNMDRFSELGGPRDLSKIFASIEYVQWNSFRESEDSRYVALAMPRVL